MKRIVVHQKERVGDWVARQMGKEPAWVNYEAIGIEQDGELIGGVVIDGFKRNVRCTIHCSGVGKRWINREFIRVVFDYVFRQLNCQCAVNYVEMGNAESLRFTAHMGFKEVCRIHEAEVVIFSLPKAECRWLTLKG